MTLVTPETTFEEKAGKPLSEGYFKIEPAVLSALSSKIVKECLGIRPGENVAIETWNHGLEVAKELVFQVKKFGAHPILLLEDEDNFWRAAAEIPPSKLGKVGRHEWAILENADAYIFVPGPENQDKLDEFSDKVSEALFAYNDEWYERARRYRIRGLRIGFGYMSRDQAETLGLNFEDWVKEELKAYDVDYGQINRAGRKLAGVLKKGNKVTISHANGTNLELKLKHAPGIPLVDTGVMKRQHDPKTRHKYSVLANLPAGSVLCVPKEDSARGTINFNLPTRSEKNFTRGVSLTFGKDGRLSSYSGGDNFEKNFKEKYEKDKKPDKGRAALLSIGLNPKQKIGYGFNDSSEGVLLFGIGHYSYGDKNKASFRFYGFLEGSTISVDNRVIVRDGKIQF